MSIDPTKLSNDIIKLNPKLVEELSNIKHPSKYGNIQAIAAGMKFQSGKEARRANELILLESKHKIYGLRCQVSFPIGAGSHYIADFTYAEMVNGELQFIVEDCKGFRTKEYKLKKRLFEERYHISIRET